MEFGFGAMEMEPEFTFPPAWLKVPLPTSPIWKTAEVEVEETAGEVGGCDGAVGFGDAEGAGDVDVSAGVEEDGFSGGADVEGVEGEGVGGGLLESEGAGAGLAEDEVGVGEVVGEVVIDGVDDGVREENVDGVAGGGEGVVGHAAIGGRTPVGGEGPVSDGGGADPEFGA